MEENAKPEKQNQITQQMILTGEQKLFPEGQVEVTHGRQTPYS